MNTFVKENKWILISGLQKSIRRGHEELTKKYAHALLEIDKGSLLYRLSIIAVEDVGLGNISLVSDFLSTRIKKDEIAKKGGSEYIIHVATELAKSVKDRSACDFVSLGMLQNTEFETDNLNLKSTYLNDEIPLRNRLIAGWEMLGASKIKNILIKNETDNLENFINANKDLGVSEPILKLIEDAYQIHREPHFIAIGLLSHLIEKEKGAKLGKFETGQFIEKDFGEPNLIGNDFLLEAIDWHTREGKSAIYDFIKTKSNMSDYLTDKAIDHDKWPDVIGKILFRYSGHQVNKRLIYPSAVVILKLCQSLEFKDVCNSSEVDFSEALKVFESDADKFIKHVQNKFKKPDPRHFPF